MTRILTWLLLVELAPVGWAAAQSGTGGASADGQTERPRQAAASPSASAAGPLTVYTTMSNAIASNVNFDRENIGSLGVILAGGIRYVDDDFRLAYELAYHSYTNTDRWDRVSHRVEAAFEHDLPDDWKLETIGRIGLKGSSEDRDLVSQDLEITPRLDYRVSTGRRLRLFTRHRVKRYDEQPESNALKHYVGAEFREVTGVRRYWEVGGRFETNDEVNDRGDYRRWTYSLEHGLPLTERDTLVLQIRYRFRRHTQRFVEVEDEDVLRTDHRWVPSATWTRSVNHRFEVIVDYTYETNYSNDPRREFGAHLLSSSLRARW